MSDYSVISIIDPTTIACHNGSQPIVASYTNYVVISCSGSKDSPDKPDKDSKDDKPDKDHKDHDHRPPFT